MIQISNCILSAYAAEGNTISDAGVFEVVASLSIAAVIANVVKYDRTPKSLYILSSACYT